MPLKLNSSGGGSVTLDTPSTASTYTLTVPAITGTAVVTGSSGTVSQGMLASGVAGNGPAFSAYKNASQTISGGTFTKLTIGAESYDTNSCYDASLSRFTPNVAGYYTVSGGFEILTANSLLLSAIYKNGSIEKVLGYASAGNAIYGSAMVYLNGSTDYIELYAYSAANNGILQSSNSTYFQGALVRAA